MQFGAIKFQSNKQIKKKQGFIEYTSRIYTIFYFDYIVEWKW